MALPPLRADSHGQSDFVGRDVDLRTFFDRSWSSVVAVNIIGLLGSGKTAFLRHVAKPDVLRRHLGTDAEEFCFVFVDMHDLHSPEEFSYRLTEHISMVAGIIAPPRRTSWLEQLRVTLSLVERRRVVILLDRLDLLFWEESFGLEFFVALRSLIEDPKLACVASSIATLDDTWLRARGAWQEARNRSTPSPLYNLFQSLRLGALEEHDIEQMIRRTAERAALSLKDDEVSWVRRTAGGLPYFVHKATIALIHTHLRDRTPIERLAEASTHFQEEAKTYYHTIWNSLKREDQRVLQHLATGVPMQPSELATTGSVRRLAVYGLLRHNGVDYVINGESLADWLCDALLDESIGDLTARERLQQALMIGFNLEELAQLYEDINADLEHTGSKVRIDAEDIGGHGKSAQVSNLINYCERRGIVKFLSQAVARLRPNIPLER